MALGVVCLMLSSGGRMWYNSLSERVKNKVLELQTELVVLDLQKVVKKCVKPL